MKENEINNIFNKKNSQLFFCSFISAIVSMWLQIYGYNIMNMLLDSIDNTFFYILIKTELYIYIPSFIFMTLFIFIRRNVISYKEQIIFTMIFPVFFSCYLWNIFAKSALHPFFETIILGCVYPFIFQNLIFIFVKNFYKLVYKIK